MKDNRKNRKKNELLKCSECGVSYRGSRCPRLNLTLDSHKKCPICHKTNVPF